MISLSKTVLMKPDKKEKPLLSITNKTPQTIIPTESKELSVNESKEPILLEPTLEEQLEPPIVLEEKPLNVISEKEKDEEIKDYWEIVFFEDKVERTVYTKALPVFQNDPNGIKIVEFFGRLDLTENVLNKNLVSYSCLLTLPETEKIIDISKGVFIKNISQQLWMLRNEQETNILFNAAVLEVYRTQTSELLSQIPALVQTNRQTTIVPKIETQKKEVPLTVPGNLNPNQPGRIKI